MQYQYQQLAKVIYVEEAEEPYYLFQEAQIPHEEVPSFDFTPEGYIYPMNAIWLDASGRAVWVNDRGDPIWSK